MFMRYVFTVLPTERSNKGRRSGLKTMGGVCSYIAYIALCLISVCFVPAYFSCFSDDGGCKLHGFVAGTPGQNRGLRPLQPCVSRELRPCVSHPPPTRAEADLRRTQDIQRRACDAAPATHAEEPASDKISRHDLHLPVYVNQEGSLGPGIGNTNKAELSDRN